MKNIKETEDKAPSTKTKVIWIPSFSVNSNVSIESPRLMMNGIKSEGDEYKMSNLDEFKNLNFTYDIDYYRSIKLTNDSSDIIIKNKFLISIVNIEVLADMNIPSLYLQIVNQENWITEG